ncbi:prephenate dehydrogenase/arogenate dehydrogenase family protein [Candidatus Villigracilis proximus]|uniref:prephenate dehydrogenase/arogenate dehydrogenase family protein n=1 Tax=Candidatus Villigracilis proximus TaxID=3140683 RepID=UPI0031E94C61
MSKLPERFDPIGGHPICGKEKLSLANAERTLYYAAPFLLTPLERTSQRALSAANQIIEALGAKGRTLDAVEHDRILASTSHLPFLISSALALATPEDVTPFVGPGFKSTSRLAGTSSSMMLGVLQSNRENVLNALRGMQAELAQIESALSDGDFVKLESLLERSTEKISGIHRVKRRQVNTETGTQGLSRFTHYEIFILHPSSIILSMKINPITHSLNATVRVPGSKSLTNRALLIASLANGTTHLTNALFSDDSRYFAKALQTLGFEVQFDEENVEMTVTGMGGKIPATQAELFIGNAGTAARFLSAFLTLGNGQYILDGEPRMRERPIKDLIDSLNQLGVEVEATNNCPPVEIFAKGLPGGKTKIAGDISSQFLSALLMVAPYARSEIEISLSTELNSKPYVDMTIAIMKDFGVEIERNGYSRFTVLFILFTNYQLPN